MLESLHHHFDTFTRNFLHYSVKMLTASLAKIFLKAAGIKTNTNQIFLHLKTQLSALLPNNKTLRCGIVV